MFAVKYCIASSTCATRHVIFDLISIQDSLSQDIPLDSHNIQDSLRYHFDNQGLKESYCPI